LLLSTVTWLSIEGLVGLSASRHRGGPAYASLFDVDGEDDEDDADDIYIYI